MKKKTIKIVKYSLPGLIVVLVLFNAFYCGITIKKYTVKTDVFNKESSIRILVIADLHNNVFGSGQQSLIQKVKRQNPDLILLAGDITDDKIKKDGTRLLLTEICKTAPVYYVEGNHEGFDIDVETVYEQIRSYGATVLSDSYERIIINGNEIIIAGVRDPYNPRYTDPHYIQGKVMEDIFGSLDAADGVYKILLAHRPEFIDNDYSKYPFDLVVSGHTHGGQVRIPFILNGIYVPGQGWFPKYAGGRYDHDGLVHIISRGLATGYSKVPRIFNPPELVVINITSK